MRLLVGGFAVEGAGLAAAATAPDASGRIGVLDQEQDLAALGRELAHELEEKVVLTNREIFHDLVPVREDRKSADGKVLEGLNKALNSPYHSTADFSTGLERGRLASL